MKYTIQQVEYIGSYPKPGDLPESNMPEFCFWGRSNVGKSSLINSICDRKEVARISSTPGKTQCFNLFKIDHRFFLMDLPGYGYARVSKKKKEFWNIQIEKYLDERKNLCLLFLLIDISIEPQKIDIDKINSLGKRGVPFYILFTKLDKCKKVQKNHHRKMLEDHLAEYWETLPPAIETSSIRNEGRDEIIKLIDKIVVSN
jgi:GTP-binding protein